MPKRTRVKQAIAVLLAVGAVAASLPATSLAGGDSRTPMTAEPGGGGH
jgi:hypothetical protein